MLTIIGGSDHSDLSLFRSVSGCISQGSSEGQQIWVTVLEAIPCTGYVVLKDQGKHGAPIKRYHPTCEVSIEVMGTDLITNHRRRVVIAHNDDQLGAKHFYWVPATFIKVSKIKNVVEIQFSNCIQMLSTTKAYKSDYEAVYEPATPNVYMKFNFRDESSAQRLQSRLLHLAGPSAPYDEEEAVFQDYCTIRYSPLKSTNRQTLGHGVFVWHRIRTGEDESECIVLDIAYFAGQVDFAIETDEGDNVVRLHLRNLMKIKYVPIDSKGYPSWPTPQVEENLEGAPAHSKFDEDEDNDTLRIEVPIACMLEVLNSTIGRKSGLMVQDWFQIDYVLNPRRIGRNKQEPVYLTLWKKDRCLYGLLKTANVGQNTNTDKSQQSWRALRWRDSLSEPPKFTHDHRVIFEDLETLAGDYLSLEPTAMLEPRARRDKIKNSSWDAAKIELRFRRGADVDRFKTRLKRYGLL